MLTLKRGILPRALKTISFILSMVYCGNLKSFKIEESMNQVSILKLLHTHGVENKGHIISKSVCVYDEGT